MQNDFYVKNFFQGERIMKTIYLAGGCFWGVQKFFDKTRGVVETETGYANGKTENPSYEDVRYHGSGHTEAVRIKYDESVVSTKTLLKYYFMIIDPLSVNKQGEDEGENYRTGIYFDDATLESDIAESVREEEAKVGQKLAVEVLPLSNFYSAEEYHQKYLEKNPTGYCHISLETFRLVNSLH